MSINLIISPSEALLIASALDFVRRSMTLSESGMNWNFRDGGKFACDTQGIMSLGYTSESLRDAVSEEANRVRFAGYCKIN